jgi:hypothetical protein
VQQHRRLLKQDHGVFIRKEIHAHELVGGRGQLSDQIINKHTRSRIFHGLLRLVAELPGVTVFNICLDVKGRRDPQLDVWDRLLNRIERTMLAAEQRELPKRKELLSKLPPNTTNPGDALQTRLLDYAPRAMIFADEGREIKITRVYRKMTVQSYPITIWHMVGWHDQESAITAHHRRPDFQAVASLLFYPAY